MFNPKKQRLIWIRQGFIGIVLLITIFSLVGFTYQTMATANDRTKYSVPGKIVQTDGYKMHLYCTGQGSPTVILEAGLGLPALAWSVIQPQIAEHTRVCSYDRAGLGWSENRPEERTAQQLADELDTLLTNAGIDDDLIFVSHSFGGLITRLYATKHAERIVGIVMVDALVGEEYSSKCEMSCFPTEMLDTIATINSTIEFLARFGAIRLAIDSTPLPMFEVAQNVPNELRPAISALFATVQHWQTNNAEFASIGISAEQALAANDFGVVPLTVISAGGTYEGQTIPGMSAEAATLMWLNSQTLLAALSINSTHIIIAEATHNSLLTHLAHAQTVISAVIKTLNR